MTLSVLANAALRGVRSALLSALVLDLAVVCPAQAAGAAAQPASNAAASAAAPERAAPGIAAQVSLAAAEPAAKGNQEGDGHEGIKVHGYWTIEVRNPDGSVASHSEFENSLAPTGAAALATLLAGTFTSGGIAIGVDLNSDPLALYSVNFPTGFANGTSTGAAALANDLTTEAGPCTGVTNLSGATDGCLIIPPVSDLTAPANITGVSTYIFPNLVVAAPQLASNGWSQSPQLMLSGSILTTAAATISDVETVYLVTNSCANPPTACTPALATNSVAIAPLTEATLNGQNGLPNALPVTAGQLIAITVVISFS